MAQDFSEFRTKDMASNCYEMTKAIAQQSYRLDVESGYSYWPAKFHKDLDIYEKFDPSGPTSKIRIEVTTQEGKGKVSCYFSGSMNIMEFSDPFDADARKHQKEAGSRDIGNVKTFSEPKRWN